MLVIACKGTPYEIGYTHGSKAKTQVERCIAFYASVFQEKSAQSWPQVRQTASAFASTIEQKWPAYLREMQGLADGAGVELLDIVALNVRTEIAFGQFSDGCTALSWKGEKRTLLGQNWDWMERQKQNLIITKITQEGKPTIQQVTEAGIIGKIGYNSEGVGTCLNAIRIKGVDASKLPVHLALRMALESSSAMEAVEKLEACGMASSAHILIADAETAVGLEFSASTIARVLPDAENRVVHANHMQLEHPGVVDTAWLKDSFDRVTRMGEMSKAMAQNGSFEMFSKLFEDEASFPVSICRAQEGSSDVATLFNIVMDLRAKTAVVRMGRPCKPEEIVDM